MRNLEHLRRRLPLIVFLMIAIVAVMLLGLACLSGDPMQALERVLSLVAAPATLAHAWTTIFAMFTASLLVVRGTATRGRASPALLQRFQF